ncbi:XtrA/YqaO family protein [Enterococcus sp. HY326]|uniref:XtrA/YqaO family protein n=1 Tax=Enterococcus sp. HY326 TaxID=2971265 RepID=UPI00223F7ACB|nr:XtrA/YqaO family protein [Enterococcus sp. HY326]
MELKNINPADIEKFKGKNAVIIISNGQMKVAELPDFGTVNIVCKDNKVKRVKEEKELLFQ